jgi:hypothetical protein
MSHRNIIEAIQKISGTKQTDAVSYVPCTVNSVNIAARTCNCTPQGDQYQASFSNVLLMASVDDGILYIPAIGSTVVVTYSKFNPPFICLYSSIDKILYTVGSSILQVIDGTVQFNDGSFGGLTKVEVLTQKLNNLENLLNELIGFYNAHTHTVTVGGSSGIATATPTTENTTLTPTQQSDIENTSIIHGV